MSDAFNGEIQINVLPQQPAINTENNREKLNTLLQGREVLPLGETDDRFRKITFLEEAYKDMTDWGMVDRSRERAGALLGFHCGDMTVITGFIGSQIAEGTSGQVHFTPEVWAELNRKNDTLNQENATNNEIMAWFHTHPVDFPPAPLTGDDRIVMSGFFSESDKSSSSDRSTIIMTTYANQPNETIAVWKWNKVDQSAVLMNGISVAHKDKDVVIQSNYYSPDEANSRVVGSVMDSITIDEGDLDNNGVLDIKDKGVSIEQNQETNVITIQLDEGPNDHIIIDLQDLDKEPETIRISLDDVTPETAKKLTAFLNKNPDSKGNKWIRNILRIAKPVLPKDTQGDIDLVLERTKPTVDQIKIVD